MLFVDIKYLNMTHKAGLFKAKVVYIYYIFTNDYKVKVFFASLILSNISFRNIAANCSKEQVL